MHAYSEPATTNGKAVSFQRDDFVLYRDPERFWRGEANHTFVCRVSRVNTYVSGGIRYTLPPADAMRDIDTAPLNTASAADEMTAVQGGLINDAMGEYMRLRPRWPGSPSSTGRPTAARSCPLATDPPAPQQDGPPSPRH
ncbi:hypothetical protein [Streptomyces sp. NPDC006463]|uniref:hypothetical protein n=1 Tax=Streptomyces sp. NPDC006463 TaxID=3364746 RepID=UPI00368DE38F